MPTALDVFNEVLIQQAIKPQATSGTSDINGTSIDTKNLIGRAAFFVDIDAVSGTTPTMDLRIQEAPESSTVPDTAGTFADVSPAIAATQATTVDGQRTLSVPLDAVKRFIRVVMKPGGTTPVYTMGGVCVAQSIKSPPGNAAA